MGIFWAFSFAILSASLSTQVTSFPRSAKQAPVTRPTYPLPIRVMFIRRSPLSHQIIRSAGWDDNFILKVGSVGEEVGSEEGRGPGSSKRKACRQDLPGTCGPSAPRSTNRLLHSVRKGSMDHTRRAVIVLSQADNFFWAPAA